MPFSDIFGTSEMGNIPGVSEMEMSVDEPMLEIRNAIAYPNWRKKMHIPVEHIEDVDAFREVVDILNRYRPNGNDGRGRYYQFVRMGNNNASTIDFAKYKRIYDIIRHKSDYRLEQILKNRYNHSYMNRVMHQYGRTQERYNKAKQEWEEFRNSPEFESRFNPANMLPIDGQTAPDLASAPENAPSSGEPQAAPANDKAVSPIDLVSFLGKGGR